VENDTAVGVHGLHEVRIGTKARDDDGHLMLHANFHVVIQTIIRLVDDLIDGERRHPAIWMCFLKPRELLFQGADPFLQLFLRPRAQSGECSHNTVRALRNRQGRVAWDEHRRADDGNIESALEEQR